MRSYSKRCFVLMCVLGGTCLTSVASVNASDQWTDLFDGQSLQYWHASEHDATWSVHDGCLVADGPRSHLFYEGPVGDHDFRNFELEVEVNAAPSANSGIYFHTQFQQKGWPDKGYEVQVNGSYTGTRKYLEKKRTGSLYAVRNIYKSFISDGEWSRIRIRVVGKRVQIWVNDYPTVDYIEPDKPYRKERMAGRLLSHGTIALQGHDEGSRVKYRSVKIRRLPDDSDPLEQPRASDAGYGVHDDLMDRFAGQYTPVIDFHVHLRGGMTLEKALARQAVTGINIGVLKNIGKGWAIETDEQLRQFLAETMNKPVFVGLQVNDRDWMTKHDPQLLKQLDYVLADTMIMPMPNDDSEPVKLWMTDQYTIEDPEAWMVRYMKHNLRVLAEPVTILANPTYLPPPVESLYDQLWTDARMEQVIQAAIANHVALEINARSGLPHDRFIRMAKKMGAKFSFGTNNFKADPIDMTRCFEAIDKYGLTKDDMYVPNPK